MSTRPGGAVRERPTPLVGHRTSAQGRRPVTPDASCGSRWAASDGGRWAASMVSVWDLRSLLEQRRFTHVPLEERRLTWVRTPSGRTHHADAGCGRVARREQVTVTAPVAEVAGSLCGDCLPRIDPDVTHYSARSSDPATKAQDQAARATWPVRRAGWRSVRRWSPTPRRGTDKPMILVWAVGGLGSVLASPASRSAFRCGPLWNQRPLPPGTGGGTGAGLRDGGSDAT